MIGKVGFFSTMAIVAPVVGMTGVAAYVHDFNMFDALIRTWRTGWAGLVTTLEYKWFYMTHPEKEPGFAEAEKAQHLWAAQRVLDVCLTQAGLYIKLGQYAAANNHIYPREWTETLRVLQDQANKREFAVVEEIFRQEFGKHPDEMFARFDREPIAAASIAQVHYAVTHEGERVAVKVQYPEIRDRFVTDMFSHDATLKALAFFFPKLDVTWAGPELKSVLAQELDFVAEAKNSERAMREFHGNNDYYVPTVQWSTSTDRILTTEWIDGAKVTDIARLRSMGLGVKEVMTKLTTCLAEQLFLTGFVHADPHPGNIFIRKHPTKRGQSQVVLLDHGLYKEVPDHVRTFYCRLYRGFVTGHYDEIRDACTDIGITDWKLMAFVIFMRPLDMTFFTDEGITISEAHELMKDKKKLMQFFHKATQQHIDEVMELMRQIPREFLLILRNNNIIRSINRELGSPINRFSVFGRQAIRGLRRSKHRSWLRRYTEYIYYEFALKRLETSMWFEGIFFKMMYALGLYAIEITADGIDIESTFEEMPNGLAM
jgi:aarF domain-containing kinase